MRNPSYLLIVLAFLSACNIPDKRIKATVVLLDAVTRKPVADIPYKFIRRAPSYMQKNKVVATGKSDANGKIVLSESVVSDASYDVEVNVHIPPCTADTSKNEFKYVPTGINRKGDGFNGTVDTLLLRPAGLIRFLVSETDLQAMGAKSLIIEQQSNRVHIGSSSSTEQLTPIPGYEPKGLIDGNLMFLRPDYDHIFKILKVNTNGVIYLHDIKTIDVPNAYRNNCGDPLVYNVK